MHRAQTKRNKQHLLWLQRRAIQNAAECTLEHDGDDSSCKAEWQVVKDLQEKNDSVDKWRNADESSGD